MTTRFKFTSFVPAAVLLAGCSGQATLSPETARMQTSDFYFHEDTLFDAPLEPLAGFRQMSDDVMSERLAFSLI